MHRRSRRLGALRPGLLEAIESQFSARSECPRAPFGRRRVPGPEHLGLRRLYADVGAIVLPGWVAGEHRSAGEGAG